MVRHFLFVDVCKLSPIQRDSLTFSSVRLQKVFPPSTSRNVRTFQSGASDLAYNYQQIFDLLLEMLHRCARQLAKGTQQTQTLCWQTGTWLLLRSVRCSRSRSRLTGHASALFLVSTASLFALDGAGGHFTACSCPGFLAASVSQVVWPPACHCHHPVLMRARVHATVDRQRRCPRVYSRVGVGPLSICTMVRRARREATSKTTVKVTLGLDSARSWRPVRPSKTYSNRFELTPLSPPGEELAWS